MVRVKFQKVVFQAMNDIGLGHIARLLAIALELRVSCPHLSILFIIEGSDHGLLKNVSIPWLNFPSVKNLYSAPWKRWPVPTRIRIARSLASSMLEAIKPDLMVFDCIPNRHLMEITRHKKIPFAICVRKMKKMGSYFEKFGTTLRDAKLIIAPHNQEDVKIPNRLIGKTKFVGYITRPNHRRNQKTKILRTPRVVITGGGGGNKKTIKFYNVAAAAFEKCRRKNPSLSGLLVTGPLFHEWKRLKTTNGLKIMPFHDNLLKMFQEVGLVICHGGYNTIAEIIRAGAPAICIPEKRKYDDQYERAQTVSATHSNIRVCMNPTPIKLASMMHSILGEGKAFTQSTVPLAGAKLAAKALQVTLQSLRKRTSL